MYLHIFFGHGPVHIALQPPIPCPWHSPRHTARSRSDTHRRRPTRLPPAWVPPLAGKEERQLQSSVSFSFSLSSWLISHWFLRFISFPLWFPPPNPHFCLSDLVTFSWLLACFYIEQCWSGASGNVGSAATIDIKSKWLNSLNMTIWSLCNQIWDICQEKRMHTRQED